MPNSYLNMEVMEITNTQFYDFNYSYLICTYNYIVLSNYFYQLIVICFPIVIWYQIFLSDTFGLVSLFNGISTFVGYLMPNPFS